MLTASQCGASTFVQSQTKRVPVQKARIDRWLLLITSPLDGIKPRNKGPLKFKLFTLVKKNAALSVKTS